MTRTTRKSQGGFTLLEMLVTVGIMAAVAGTATVALQDTTARASAAAHVAMMDELNEGVRMFRAIPGDNFNSYPNNLDSLLLTETAGDTTAADAFSNATNLDDQGVVEFGDFDTLALDANEIAVLGDIGMTALQYADSTLDPADAGDCTAIADLINSRGNAVVGGNIFMTPAGNGCGFSGALVDGSVVTVWNGGSERLTGQPQAGAYNANGEPVYMTVGFGPASNLFDASVIGGLTSVPVYRHVAADQYNRFIGVFKIGTYDSTNADGGSNGVLAIDQVSMVTVVDGAGDTKEEELGEWDGTRNTI